MTAETSFRTPTKATALVTTIILNTVSAVHLGWWSFLRGAASAFDLRGRTNRSYSLFETADEADLTAIQNDWETVSDDLGAAIHAVAG